MKGLQSHYSIAYGLLLISIYVLVIIEHFIRYLQLIPLQSKDAEMVTVAFMEKYVNLFGPPNLKIIFCLRYVRC